MIFAFRYHFARWNEQQRKKYILTKRTPPNVLGKKKIANKHRDVEFFHFQIWLKIRKWVTFDIDRFEYSGRISVFDAVILFCLTFVSFVLSLYDRRQKEEKKKWKEEKKSETDPICCQIIARILYLIRKKRRRKLSR